MAERFLIYGATYNGDGTTSAEAASNGGAGAWNQQSILTGTAPSYGSLAAGDVVYIRSKTGNGVNANIVHAFTGAQQMGSASATAAAWITWVLDHGSKWPAINGALTCNCGSGATATLASYNRIVCGTQDAWKIVETTVASNKLTFAASFFSEVIGALIDLSAANAGYGARVGTANGVTLKNVHIKSANRYQSLFAALEAYGATTFINCDIELLNAAEATPVFQCGAYGGTLSVIGGRVRGAGATSGVVLFDPAHGQMSAVGLQYPATMTASAFMPYACRSFSVVGADAGVGGVGVSSAGSVSSRNDGYFPTLNATLPTSTSAPWSWWAYPLGASPGLPLRIKLSKLYTSAAASQTITLDFLVASGFSGVNKSNCVLDVVYIDSSTGDPVLLSTYDPAAASLDASAAAWSATTYGAVTLHKRKLSVTTPTAIKQDTAVVVMFSFGVSAPDVNGILFVDPDPQLS